MSLRRITTLSSAAALILGSAVLYAETNTTAPQIPTAITVDIINNNGSTIVEALPPSLQLSATGTTTGVNKNTKLGLHLNSVNMQSALLQSDSSVELITEGDFLYTKFSQSGTHTITAIGKALDGTDINSSVTFDVINRAPISIGKDFVINANEILKFDAYTYFFDADDENLTFNKSSLPSQGSLEINNNRVTYYPNTTAINDYNTTFEINASDIDGSSVGASFSVNVTAQNETINLVGGWNLLGNSGIEGINVADINLSGETLWPYVDGAWNQSITSIKPKQGFWLHTLAPRVLEIKTNGDATAYNPAASTWTLRADSVAKTLKSLKFGNDAVYTYKEGNWFKASDYPDYEVKRYDGFWTLDGSVTNTTTSTTTTTTQTFSSLNKYHKHNINQPTTVNDITGWVADTSLPQPILHSQAVVTSSKVYLLGGHNGTSYLNTVYSASIEVNGSIGGWSLETNSLPDAIGYSQAVITKDRVLLLGGHNNAAQLSSVYSAPIDSNGSIGVWVPETSLLQPIDRAQAITMNNKVYLLGGHNGSTYLNTVYSTSVDANGSIGTWQVEQSLPNGLAASQAVVTNSKIYLLGGESITNSTDIVYSTTFDTNGSIGIWQTEANLPTQLSYQQTIMTKERVYMLSGNVVSTYSTSTYSAPIDANGNIGTWSVSSSLPGILAHTQAVVTKNKVYLLGGYSGSAYTGVVYSAPFADGWEITGNSY